MPLLPDLEQLRPKLEEFLGTEGLEARADKVAMQFVKYLALSLYSEYSDDKELRQAVRGGLTNSFFKDFMNGIESQDSETLGSRLYNDEWVQEWKNVFSEGFVSRAIFSILQDAYDTAEQYIYYCVNEVLGIEEEDPEEEEIEVW